MVFWLVVTAFVAVAAASPLRDLIERSAERPLEFWFRQAVGAEPVAPDNLKIFEFDDKTLQEVRDRDLSVADWALILDYLQKHDIRCILIDKIFGILPRNTEGFEALQQALRQKSSRVGIGSFWTNTAIPGRTMMGQYSQDTAVQAGATLPPAPGGMFYGPDPAYLNDFHTVGHIVHEGSGYVLPIVGTTAGQPLAYLGLLAAKTLAYTADGIVADGERVWTDHKGRLLVNIHSTASMQRFSIKSLLGLARAGAPIPQNLKPDDVMLILPEMFTGSVDTKETFVGRLSGGYLVASVIASVLTGNWLQPIDLGFLGIASACLLGVVFGNSLGATAFTLALGGVTAVIVGGALFFFTRFGVVTDWIFLFAGFHIAGTTVFFERSGRLQRLAIRTREALSGLVPPERLEEIIANPAVVRFEPAEKILTIVFIDIVGFSTLAETKPAYAVFAQLKEAIGRITALVHEHGGIVDRTMGDGLLCYFGHTLGADGFGGNHAHQAIRCAIEIQRATTASIIASEGDRDRAVFPLRIGINTGGVFLGDLGDGQRLDYTVIGHGVNFGQRLEAACEPFRVMVSKNTKSLVNDQVFEGVMTNPRWIQIKHHSEAIETFELSLSGTDEARAQKIHNKRRDVSRGDTRQIVPAETAIRVHCELGDGRLHDFSRDGFSLLIKQYLGRGFTMKFEFVDLGLSVFAEVRWGRPTASGYLHGIQIKHLRDEESAALFQRLLAVVSGDTHPSTSDRNAA